MEVKKERVDHTVQISGRQRAVLAVHVEEELDKIFCF
jgi:hypothetical protein